MSQLTHKPAATPSAHWESMQQTPLSPIKLTLKEQETLEWIAVGKSAWEVSRILGKSEAAVNFHLCNIRRKFGVNSLRLALVMAIEQGVIVLN
jgi:LuxR family quorum-sensing transcriptional regulator LasR